MATVGPATGTLHTAGLPPTMPGDALITGTQAKLGALRDQFSGFQGQWEAETRSRMERHSTRLDENREAMTKLEQTLNLEIKRRVEANKALNSMFESQIATIEERLEAMFTERLDKLQEGIDSLAIRMAQIEDEFAKTRDQYIQEIEEKNAVIAKSVNGVQNASENEKIDRKERELAISKKIGDHEARMQAAFAAQAQARRQRYQSFWAELEEVKLKRQKGDEKFQTFILEEVAGVKNGLAAEGKAREQADDDIVQALNHYTKCLQDALRIVNQS